MKLTKFILSIPVLFLLIFACSKEVVNLREMTPEDQFAHAKKYYDKGDYYKAKTQFTMVALNNAGSTIIDKTQYYLADSHFHQKEYIQAISEFEKLIRSLPQSEFVDDARFKVGLSYYELSPGYALDQEYTLKAVTQFESFLDEFPTSDLRPEVEKKLHDSREKIAKKEFKTGDLYRKMGYFRAATISYENVLREFANSSFVDDALYRKGECHLKMDELDQAEEAFRAIIMKHSSGPFAEDADQKLKKILEERQSQAETQG